MGNDDKLILTLESTLSNKLESTLSNKRSDVALENRIHREHENTIEHILIVLNRENINVQILKLIL